MVTDDAASNAPVPKQRRGTKRLIIGIAGIVLSAAGIPLLPFLGSLLGTVIGNIAMTGPHASENRALFALHSRGAAVIFVAEGDSASSCTIITTAKKTAVESLSTGPVETVDGVTYRAAYRVTSREETVVLAECARDTAIAYRANDPTWRAHMQLGGLILPIAALLIFTIVVISGGIGLIRSRPRRRSDVPQPHAFAAFRSHDPSEVPVPPAPATQTAVIPLPHTPSTDADPERPKSPPQ